MKKFLCVLSVILGIIAVVAAVYAFASQDNKTICLNDDNC